MHFRGNMITAWIMFTGIFFPILRVHISIHSTEVKGRRSRQMVGCTKHMTLTMVIWVVETHNIITAHNVIKHLLKMDNVIKLVSIM